MGFIVNIYLTSRQLRFPLQTSPKKGQPTLICWGAAQDQAFQKLKQALAKKPILRIPDFSREFIIQTDASESGVGAALLQEFDDGKFPIEYASKKLLPRESRYSVIERECLAVVWAVRRFVKYLYGRPFILETDHHPLAYLNQVHFSNARLVRWTLFLQNYRFQVRAIDGKSNVVADYLSRAN